jgi:EAL domain-containing protein (putative c-di-GMP-specific phosphodiesterase class I)/GGDEF domain-containing protein
VEGEGSDYYRLRAEWLRLKNHVFDANTGLPTLTAVLDEVRKLVEDAGSVGVVYLDLARGGAIESAHGWHAYDEALRSFASALSGLRREGPLEPRDIVALLSVRSDKFLIFCASHTGKALDSKGLDRAVVGIREALHKLIPHYTGGIPLPMDFHDGSALLGRDPMLRSERSVHRALDEAMYMSLRRRARQEDLRATQLDSVLRHHQLMTFYQPIVDLRTLEVLGHEVFTRGPAGGPFEDAEGLFALAERTHRLGELERLSRNQAFLTAEMHLPKGKKLFLNTSAGTLHDPELSRDLLRSHVIKNGLSESQVVLEVTERVAMTERRAHQAILHNLKRSGFGIAIDDMGAGYSSLQAVVELEPDYLKFDTSLVRNIDKSLIKRSLLETLVEISQKIGALVVAEGIEARSEFTTLRDFGVPLGQGHYLAPPAPVVLR